jgi:hypothetical protein
MHRFEGLCKNPLFVTAATDTPKARQIILKFSKSFWEDMLAVE